LEYISAHSGSAASIVGGDKQITGLSGLTSEDVGHWITVYGLGNDQAGHYEIASVDSATAVTVTRGSNFVADGNNGSIDWAISRHPNNWSFFAGDRYRLDQYSETADRTVLIGGVSGNAEVTQDINDILDFIGAADGDSTPTLTNTGNYYIYSDLADASDTNLEEIVNTINQEVGNRDYSALALSSVTGLADGQTITESIEYLALAIGESSMTRVIERLTSEVTKNTEHTLPGGNTYTLGSGQHMWVFWRHLLRDPGTVANDDDYEETSTTSITPYTKILSGDHINYMILKPA
jgi:hypothetical protein